MKMEFDSAQIARYFEMLKQLEWELLAHRSVLEALGRSVQLDLGLALQSARLALKQSMEEKYDQALTNLLALPTENERAQAFSRILEEWNPKAEKPI